MRISEIMYVKFFNIVVGILIKIGYFILLLCVFVRFVFFSYRDLKVLIFKCKELEKEKFILVMLFEFFEMWL